MQFQRVFQIAAAKYGKEGRCLLLDIENLSMANQHVAWLNAELTYPLTTEFGNCRTGNDAFDLIFHKRKFDCVIMLEKSGGRC